MKRRRRRTKVTKEVVPVRRMVVVKEGCYKVRTEEEGENLIGDTAREEGGVGERGKRGGVGLGEGGGR